MEGSDHVKGLKVVPKRTLESDKSVETGAPESLEPFQPTNLQGFNEHVDSYSKVNLINSLYFPIQIFIHSERVDINPYLERLQKIRQEQDNMLLAMLTDDYIGFMADLAQQTNIMDKRFYLVLPYFPAVDIQKTVSQSKNFFSGIVGLFDTKQKHVVINERDLGQAKDELKNRVQALLGALQQCSLQGLPLDTQELIELYYNTYNPDTATRQGLQSFDDLNATVVSKGQGVAPQPNLDREIPQ